MSSGRKHIMGFANFNAPSPPEPPKETKVNYVSLALDKYLKEYKPYDPSDEDNPQEFKTSKEIQGDLSSMVTASISTITEYMVENGYQMISVEGGGLAWHLQSDLPF